MNKLDTTEANLHEEEKKKNKLITAYRIPMVSGSSFYGIASTDAPAAPDGGSSSNGGGE